jgi:hypothetical protein
MKNHTTLLKMLCAAVLSAGILNFNVVAEETPKDVAGLEAALEKANQDMAAAQAKITQLEAELKASKIQANELEEQLFVATDGKGLDGEEVVEELPEGIYPWTENMRRLPIGVLFPKTATIPKGEVYARFSHVSQNPTFVKGGGGDPFDDLLGLEDGVKIGILFGYGIAPNWDVMVQRQNGRDYTGLAPGYEDRSYDLWDVMTKYKILNEDEHGVDAAVSVGTTVFWQDDNHMEFAGNAALLVEKSMGRFRAGSGLLYTSLSTYEAENSFYQDNKYYKNEETFGDARPQNHTLAIPLSLSLALNARHQLFGEAAFPVDGYDTGNSPSMAAGWRYNTPTHAYSLYLSNTANGSFNSAFTGGYRDDQFDLFGFDISIFF